ncbi:hypothetical protein BDN67DRAFT_130062 [Paxillus ammoniavirescens]|nr:hypothetical protein BDN67DRAFT_130062 [Paxillus ammoniavirescens]
MLRRDRKEHRFRFIWVGTKLRSLKEFQITDVEVAFRDSLFTQSAGPQIFNVSSIHAITYVRNPLTPALGLQIAARVTLRAPDASTSAKAVKARGSSPFQPGMSLSRRTQGVTSSTPARNPASLVAMPSSSAENRSRTYPGPSWSTRIGCQAILVGCYKNELEGSGEAGEPHDDDAQEKERKKFKDLLQEAEEAINTLNEFHGEVTKNWSAESQRVLDHVAHSPPISFGTGPKRFTEDWALIESHGEKIDWEAFKGNVIDLRTF